MKHAGSGKAGRLLEFATHPIDSRHLEFACLPDHDQETLPSHWLGKPTTSQRIRVLCAAEIIFARDGFSNAEQIDIASLARVGKSTLYKVAESKQALFLLVVSENLAYMQSLFFAHLISQHPPLERIRLAAHDILSQIQGNRGLLRVIVQEAGVFGGEIQRRYLSTIDTSMPMVEAFFNLLREQTSVPDAPVRDIMHMTVNMLIGTAYSWAITGQGDLVEEGMRYLHILEQVLLKAE